MNFETYLNTKPLYYDKIDLERMPRIYAKIAHLLNTPKIIHIIGTNGKGTTGRFLASSILNIPPIKLQNSKVLRFKENLENLSVLEKISVGHYTSPHILEFNERIWLNGKNATDEELQNAHLWLQEHLSTDDADALSYFEYTTLLAMVVFRECDFVVLEAGLGGEHDATSVFKNILTLITPIDYDHEAFLGNTLKSIATTKLKAVQNHAILAPQRHSEVYQAALMLNIAHSKTEELLDADDAQKIEQIAHELSLAPYLKTNLSLAISALKKLGIAYEADDFNGSLLFGRLSKISENIYLDVGHNTLAAHSIADSLKNKKLTLIYNSYADKNYREILTILYPIIQEVEILKIDNERITPLDSLQQTLDELGITHSIHIECKDEKNYLVFGSFSVAEEFLKRNSK